MTKAITLTKGERTRANIVATAAALFWRKSFHGVSVDLVADHAEVNKATVYRYFADKNALAIAAVKYNASTTGVMLDEIFEQLRAPHERLAEFYHRLYLAHCRVHEELGDLLGCPIIGLALELGQELPQVRIEAQAIFEEIERRLTIIADDAIALGKVAGKPEVLGRTLTQLIHGANASSRVAADPGRILDAGRASLSLIGFPETPIVQ